MDDQTQESQGQEPAADPQDQSNLGTAEPDQPVESPPVPNQSADVPARTNEEQQAQQDQREQELEQDRQEHNARSGGGETTPGETAAARQEHNDRTGGTDS